MIRVVIDTNVVVSANLVDAGPSAAIFQLAVNRRMIRMCISPAVLAEYEEVLKRPRLKLAPAKIGGAVSLIRGAAQMVHPTATLQISPHDSDNRFYECAEAAQADYLITGNTRDFSQGPRRHQGHYTPRFRRAGDPDPLPDGAVAPTA